jgi:hypothetical protein
MTTEKKYQEFGLKYGIPPVFIIGTPKIRKSALKLTVVQ